MNPKLQLGPGEGQSPLKGHTLTHHRQYRLQITKLTQGMSERTFLAYCVVSKESSMGFVHQRLLVLDTAKKQLSYYSEYPKLPLSNAKQLGNPKETVNYCQAKKFQFVLQKIRIGHVTVRWIDKSELRSWKLIMGSNKLAQEFSKLIADDRLSVSSRVALVLSQSQASQPLTSTNIVKGSSDNIPESVAQPNGKRGPKQLRQQSNGQIQIKQNIKITQVSVAQEQTGGQRPLSISQDIKRAQNATLSYFNQQYKSVSLQKPTGHDTRPAVYHNYHAYNPLRISDFSPPTNQQKPANLVAAWLDATDAHTRAEVYLQFLSVCKTKVKSMMENFFSTHLQHEQEEGMCVLYDGDVRYTYCPLLDSLEQQLSPEILVQKVLQEESCFEEWESLNYLSGFQRIRQFRVKVPLSCIVSFKGTKFYCKTTVDYYPQKQLLDDNEIVGQHITQLQEATHVKLRHQSARIYVLQNKHGQIIYFDKIVCLPTITSRLPLSYHYIQNHISKGVVSSLRDLDVINDHIKRDLIKEAISMTDTRQVSSAFEVASGLEDSGLTCRYLHLVFKEAQKGYFRRLVLSEMVSLAVEWEVRRNIQFELFKKRDIGFAANQVKRSLNMLFQSQQHYLTFISKALEAYYQQQYEFESCPIDSYIVGEAVLSEVLSRLGLDCKLKVPSREVKDWIWKSDNIENRIQFTFIPVINSYRWDCFSSFPSRLLHKELFSQINYQLQAQTRPSSVLDILKVQTDSKGSMLASALYQLLPKKHRIEVNYFLSHFLAPTFDPKAESTLQSFIYSDFDVWEDKIHSLEFLTVLNHARWLVKHKQHHKAEKLALKLIQKAVAWNQAYVLVQTYYFLSQFKLKQGDTRNALQLSNKALQAAMEHYQQEHTLLMQLLIAEQAFETANIYFGISDFSKALQLYSKAENILNRLDISRQSVSLNPEFMILYERKCSIFLLYGDYQSCLNECLEGLECSRKIARKELASARDYRQFTLYEILFRCYDIQKMRREMIEVSQICTLKFFQDKVLAQDDIDSQLLAQLVKMAWNSIIKQIELTSSPSLPAPSEQEQLRYILLAKVKKQLVRLRKRLRGQIRFTTQECAKYLQQRIRSKMHQRVDNRLKGQIMQGMVEASGRTLQGWEGNPFSGEALKNEALLLEVLATLAGFDYLVGCIDASLHCYSFQY